MKTFVAYIFAVLLAIMPAAVAHADPTDDRFLNDLAMDGITGDPAQLIPLAHTVCDTASSYHGYEAQQQSFAVVQNTLHLAPIPASGFINSATFEYCPEYRGLGNTFGPGNL